MGYPRSGTNLIVIGLYASRSGAVFGRGSSTMRSVHRFHSPQWARPSASHLCRKPFQVLRDTISSRNGVAMANQKLAANGSQPRRDLVTSASSPCPNPKSKSQPNGVAADVQGSAESPESMVKVGNVNENQNVSTVQALPPLALSCEDAAKFIGVSEGTIRYLIRTEILPVVKLFSQKGHVILVADLEELLWKHRTAIDEGITSTEACD